MPQHRRGAISTFSANSASAYFNSSSRCELGLKFPESPRKPGAAQPIMMPVFPLRGPHKLFLLELLRDINPTAQPPPEVHLAKPKAADPGALKRGPEMLLVSEGSSGEPPVMALPTIFEICEPREDVVRGVIQEVGLRRRPGAGAARRGPGGNQEPGPVLRQHPPDPGPEGPAAQRLSAAQRAAAARSRRSSGSTPSTAAARPTR